MGLQFLLKELTKDFGKERVSHLNAKRCKKFIEKRLSTTQRRARYIYLKAFMEFCAGKKNVYCDDSPWLKRNPIMKCPSLKQRRSVFIRLRDCDATKGSEKRDVFGYYIFRLF